MARPTPSAPCAAPRAAPRARRRFVTLTISVALVITAIAAPGAAAATSTWSANCNTNLRTAPSLSATVKQILSTGGTITADGTVTGDAWSVTCNGDFAGNTWFKVVEVNGQSTTTLFGLDAVYAATGVFSPWTPPSTTMLEGIDISHWQGAVDFDKVRGAGKTFVVAKATEGIGFTDVNWTTYRNNARAAGLAITGYHFARPDGNPTKPREEAKWFVSQLGLQPGMLVPALDLERSGGMSKAALADWVGQWLDEVYVETGVKAMIYTSPYFWKTYVGDTRQFADAGYTVLWIAHWGVSAPSVPASNWGGKGWTFWQYGGGPVPGISGTVDLDKYNGTDLTRVTYGADFSLSQAASLTASVKQGATTSFDISINRTFFTLPVTLTVSGAPAGATATLNTSSTSGTTATLTVRTSNSGTVTPTGTYPLTVTGTANGLTRTATVNVVVTDGIAPVAAAPRSSQYSVATLGSSSARVRSAWSATDAKGVTGFTVQRQANGGSWTTVGLATATTTSIAESLGFGITYRYRMQARDANGNTSAWATGPAFMARRVQQSSTAVTYSGTWRLASSTAYSGGSVKYSTSKGAAVTYRFTGASIAWVSTRSTTRGSADVYIDGVYKATVNLYASSFQAQRAVFAYNWTTNGTHTIRIVNRATYGHPRVDVDAFNTLVLQ